MKASLCGRNVLAVTLGLGMFWACPGLARGEAAAPPDSAEVEARLLRAYLPKDDLGIPQFLQEHPGSDGRGVVVAILDTGVDLQHPGLLQTPQGERKILDVYDATDNGLCTLPLTRQAPGDTLVGLSGRDLHLGAHRSDDGLYRLGRLTAREIFPPGSLNRILGQRKEERDRLVSIWEDRATAQEDAETRPDKEIPKDSLPPPDRARSYREIRRQEDRAFYDPGPVLDLVAFRQKGTWALLIDTDGDGDLGDEIPLHPYGQSGEVAVLPPPASLSLALSWIAEDGSSVSLFFDEGGHGTHVAGIVGAWYGPDDPLNGLAPGVRFLAVKIGNGRVGGSTSHNSMLKALDWAVLHGAMVVNVSFGGVSYFGDGRDINASFFDEVVQNHGMLIACSAGNEGPCLSTVGSPGTGNRIFTLGAAISPAQMLTSYGGLAGSPGISLRARAGEDLRLFHFSSRGPLTNGSRGIDFVTPGAAVSPLPTWLLTRNENWNGTSMAAPQAAGCLALLLSAALRDSLPVSPARIDRALRATAKPLAGVTEVEQGAGLIQVPSAYRALRDLARVFPVPKVSSADSVQVPGIEVPATRDPVTFWTVRVDNAAGTGRGYYERDQAGNELYWKTFAVSPDLPPAGANSLRDRFQRVMKLESSVPWMEGPPQISMPASGASIRVRFDPAKMSPGLNVGHIRLLDLAQADGRARLVPITGAPGTEVDLLATVIRPETSPAPDFRLVRTFELAPGERQSWFVRVPPGATRVRLRLREELAEPANTYFLAATAISLEYPATTLRSNASCTLRQGEERTYFSRVEPGTCLETALFARWVNPVKGRLSVEMVFDGVTGPSGLGSPARFEGEQGEAQRWGERPLCLAAGTTVLRIPLRAELKGLDLSASADITGRVEPLAIEWDLRPDSLYTRPMEGKDALIMLGRGWLCLDRDESVTIDLHAAPEMDDFLGDSFCRLSDPNGRLCDTKNLSSGPFTLRAPKNGPAHGWYRVELSLFVYGRDFLRNWPFLRPEVVRSASPGRLTLYPNAVSAQTSAADSSWSIPLLLGARRALGLAVHDFPGDGVFLGKVLFRDRADLPALLRVPIAIDTRTAQADKEQDMRDAVARLEENARRALALPPGLSHDELKRLLADLDQAEAALRGWRGADYERSPEAWNRLCLRVDLWLRQGGRDREAVIEAGRLLDEAERQRRAALRENEDKEARSAKEKNPATLTKPSDLADQAAEDRRRQGAIELRRARVALLQSDLAQAGQMLNTAAAAGFGGEDPSAVLGELRSRQGRALEAVNSLRAARQADPTNPGLAGMEISTYLDLGWLDLAREDLTRWLDLYPAERSTFLTLVKRLAVTAKAAEARDSGF